MFKDIIQHWYEEAIFRNEQRKNGIKLPLVNTFVRACANLMIDRERFNTQLNFQEYSAFCKSIMESANNLKIQEYDIQFHQLMQNLESSLKAVDDYVISRKEK